MISLPAIMVAPNGARHMKADHPALPITIDEIGETAAACQTAGAGAIHAHVRDGKGCHMLDAGLYRELIAEIATRAPGMLVQITTEAVGVFSPEEQRAVVTGVKPTHASVALREMIATPNDVAAARRFYHEAQDQGTQIQHILYTPDEVERLAGFIANGTIPANALSVLFVLGRYDGGASSTPAAIDGFLNPMRHRDLQAEWMVCAFGQSETHCLRAAYGRGGKMRVGFENNWLNADGGIAPDNAARVAAIAHATIMSGEGASSPATEGSSADGDPRN